MGYLLIILLAAVLIYIFYVYQAMYAEDPCYATLFLSWCHRFGSCGCDSDRLSKYHRMRTDFLALERKQHIGGSIVLSELEKEVYEKIMREKQREYDEGFLDPKTFLPSQHFFTALNKINSTPLFQMISTMPKGGILHAHDMALASSQVVLELPYLVHLWVLLSDSSDKFSFTSFRFSREQPSDGDGLWVLLKNLRESEGAKKVDEALLKRFVLYPRSE